MMVSVVYDYTGENNFLSPTWMMLDGFNTDWSKTIYINVEAPFERFTFDEINTDTMALSVPDLAYVRHHEDQNRFGIYLPSLKKYIKKTLKDLPQKIEFNEINRLMLRINDIEDAMQCEIKSKLRWY